MLSIPANVFARLLCTGGTQTKKETIAGLPASVALQPKQKMQWNSATRTKSLRLGGWMISVPSRGATKTTAKWRQCIQGPVRHVWRKQFQTYNKPKITPMLPISSMCMNMSARKPTSTVQATVEKNMNLVRYTTQSLNPVWTLKSRDVMANPACTLLACLLTSRPPTTGPTGKSLMNTSASVEKDLACSRAR